MGMLETLSLSILSTIIAFEFIFLFVWAFVPDYRREQLNDQVEEILNSDWED
jgi:hypothetical protein